MKRLVLACLVVTGLHVAMCRADEARIPVYQPTIITQPGHYILTRDIAGGSGNVITIQANDVTLDLNGRTIRDANPVALIMIADGFSRITIRNGRLSGGDTGIGYGSVAAGLRLTVEKVEFSGSSSAIAIAGATVVSILSCRIAGAGPGAAVLVRGLGDSSYTGQFLDNVIEESGASALVMYGLRAGLIRGNVITHFGKATSFAWGIEIGSSVTSDQGGNVIEHNTIRGSDDDIGIVIDGTPSNLVDQNSVSGLGASGILISSNGNRVVGNVTSGDQCGICSSGTVSRNILERNHAENNAFDGIRVEGDFNLFDANVSEGNGQFGIDTSGTGSAYRNNMLRNNTVGAVAGAMTDAGGNIL